MDPSLTTTTYAAENHSWLGSAEGLEHTRGCTIRKAALVAGTHYPNGYIPSGTPLARYTSGPYAGMFAPVAAIATEVKTVTITGTPTGGTCTLTLDGATTGSIAYNAAASAVQSALEAIATINPGDVVVTGSAGGPWTLTFAGRYAGTDVPTLTASGSGLTGGSTPGVSVATSTEGGPAATDGTAVLIGFLAHSIRVGAGNPMGDILLSGQIIEANLPIAVSAAQKATSGRFLYF